MTNNIKIEELKNRSTVELNCDIDDYGISTRFYRIGERILRTAVFIPQGEFIGIQVAKEMEQAISCTVFSSDNVELSKDDINWFFKDCGVVGKVVPNICIKSDKKRWISYILSVSEDARIDTKVTKRKYIYDDAYDDAYDEVSVCYIDDMFTFLMSEGAAIQFMAVNSSKNSIMHGVVIIRLPEKMSLRMKSIISFVFPHMVAKEMTDDSLSFIPDEAFMRILSGVLIRSRKEYQLRMENDITYIDEKLFIEEDEEDEYEDDEEGSELLNRIVPLESDKYINMLDDLIGLDNVKAQVKKIIAFAKMKAAMLAQGEEAPLISLNMEFTGNPGTAKTTVARILSGILYENGLLAENGIVEVGRADLVARYEGQTADNVKRIFNEAKGKLLFIDEAYSLIEHQGGLYGDEAINTIVQEMENNREDTIVIFAGYPDKMKEFFERNPGLKSRVPFSIHFDDYSSEEMIKIVEYEAAKKGFTISDDAKEKVLSICKSVEGNQSAGNGRFCRNLVEASILEYATRMYGKDEKITECGFVLNAEEFDEPTAIINSKKTNAIGFHV